MQAESCVFAASPDGVSAPAVLSFLILFPVAVVPRGEYIHHVHSSPLCELYLATLFNCPRPWKPDFACKLEVRPDQQTLWLVKCSPVNSVASVFGHVVFF
jgi:hypothetical protein